MRGNHCVCLDRQSAQDHHPLTAHAHRLDIPHSLFHPCESFSKSHPCPLPARGSGCVPASRPTSVAAIPPCWPCRTTSGCRHSISGWNVTRRRCRLQDLDSRNGTTVNGRKVTRAVLADGDMIVAGETEFRVHIEGAVPPDPIERRGPAESAKALAMAPFAPIAPLRPHRQRAALSRRPLAVQRRAGRLGSRAGSRNATRGRAGISDQLNILRNGQPGKRLPSRAGRNADSAVS